MHYWLAVVSVAAAVSLAVEAGWRAIRRRPAGRLADWFATLLLLALLIASAGGLGVALGGGAPAEPLHYLYAAIGIAIVPIGVVAVRRRSPRWAALGMVVAGLIAVVVIARLFQTG